MKGKCQKIFKLDPGVLRFVIIIDINFAAVMKQKPDGPKKRHS